MRIEDLAFEPGEAGSHRNEYGGNMRPAWRSVIVDLTDDANYMYHRAMMSVYHYDHLMLRYYLRDGVWDQTRTAFVSTGIGSVSDQNGMNKLFKQLGMPFYYSRQGGAAISGTNGYLVEVENLTDKGEAG